MTPIKIKQYNSKMIYQNNQKYPHNDFTTPNGRVYSNNSFCKIDIWKGLHISKNIWMFFLKFYEFNWLKLLTQLTGTTPKSCIGHGTFKMSILNLKTNHNFSINTTINECREIM